MKSIKRRIAMKAAISVIVSAIGSYFTEMDFSSLFLFISVSIEIYGVIIEYTNDKSCVAVKLPKKQSD